MGGKKLFRFFLTLGLAVVGLAVLLGLLTGPQEHVLAAVSQPSADLVGEQEVPRPLPRLEPPYDLARGLVSSPPMIPLRDPAASTVITVCKVSAGPCDYSSVQAAVNAAADGDVIKVAQGTYVDTGTCVVEIDKSLTLRGGFTTTGLTPWVISDPDRYPTVLDGESNRPVVCVQAGAPTVEGFHIRNGHATTNGAGVYIAGGGPAVRRNRIYANAADASGGGVYVVGGSAVLENNLIYANTANDGGGIYIADGSAVVGFSTLYDNQAAVLGGGLYLASGTPIVTSSIVVSNVAGANGGGFYKDVGIPSEDVQVEYNVVFGNDPQNYDGFAGSGDTYGNNIHLDPQFVGPLAVGDPALVNLRLKASSPCIGKAGPDYPDLGPGDDYDGYGRPFGAWPDIGAHEFYTGACFARVDSGRVYTTVQEAVAGSVAGGLIKVAGWCTNTGTNVVNVTKALILRGGYTLTNWSDPDPVAFRTTLDGERERRVVYVGSDVNATIEGFHIYRGYVDGERGPGVHLAFGSDSIIQGNWIYSNTAIGGTRGFGGGVYVDDGSPIVRDNEIYSNYVQLRGGGIYVGGTRDGDVIIEGNLIHHNVAANGGGGVNVDDVTPQGDVVVQYNEIWSNDATASKPGGGIFCSIGSCVIRHNVIHDNVANQGGGISNASAGGNATSVVEDNRIYENEAAGSGIGMGGGGIYAEDTLLAQRNVISGNTAVLGRGGGVYAFSPDAVVDGNRIYSNTADMAGGVYLRNYAVAQNNLVYANVATGDGGGFGIHNGTVENNTIYGNVATNAGGGVYRYQNDAYVRNNVVVSNTAGGGAGGFHGGGVTEFIYNDIWGNVGGTQQCYIGGYVDCTTMGTGNIGADPLFLDTGEPLDPDLHLQAGSPCIGAVLTTTHAVYDYDNYARPFGVYADMGAHEFYAGTCFARLSTGGRVYTAVQAAVLTATAGVEDVLVAGVCEGESGMVTIDKSLALRGGYVITDWEVPFAPTILDGQGQGRVVTITAASPSTVTVERLVIAGGNAGAGNGGGIYVSTSLSPTIQNVIFYNNVATNGGGFASAGGNPRLYNNTFVSNTGTSGGGLYLGGSGSPIVSNTIVVSNTGGGIYGPSSTSLAYNDVLNNGGADYGGGLTQGPTDISVPPRFDDPTGPVFRLSFDSLCLHAGDPGTGLAEDLEGDLRPDGTGQGQRYDIGADEATDYLGISLEADEDRPVITGQGYDFTYVLTNSSTRAGDFFVDSTLVVIPVAGDTSAGQWQWGHPSDYAGLAPGEGVAVPITVGVATTALSGTQATLLMTATYQSGGIGFRAVASHTMIVRSDWGLVLLPSTIAGAADPGDVITYTHVLTNVGGADTFTLVLSSTLGWATVIPAGPVSLGSGGSMPIDIRVSIPVTASSDALEVTVLVATSQEAAAIPRVVRDVVTDTTTVKVAYGDRYVATTADGGNDYGGLNNCLESDYPCESVGQALDQVQGGETVRVAEGTYDEAGLLLNKAIVLQGGHTTDDWGLFDPDARPTVIDADQAGRVLNIVGSTPIVEGLTLRNGKVSGRNGGGVQVLLVAAPTLRRVIIADNVAEPSAGVGGRGGGVYNEGDITLERCTLAGNTARHGSGFYNQSGAPNVWDNLFYNNVSADNGGGFYNQGGSPQVRHNTMLGNTADRGGGLYLAGGSPVVSNTIVVSNTARVDGGGVFWNSGIVGHNDAWNNTPNDYDSGSTRPATDIDADPDFMDAASLDIHLLRTSPCRDQGGWVDEPANDFDGQPRVMNGMPDIGADEYQRADVALSPGTSKVAGQGEWVPYTHTLTNIGNYNDSYLLTWQSDWPVMVNGYATQPVTVSVLAKDEVTTVVVSVQVPVSALSSTVRATIVTATSQVALSQGETDVYATAVDTTIAGRTVAIALEPPERDGWAEQSRSWVYTHTLTNTGNYTDAYSLESRSIGEVSAFWPSVPPLSPSWVELGPGMSTAVYMTITVPPDAGETEWNVAFITATSNTDVDVWAVVTDTTIAERTFGVRLEPGESYCSADPGASCFHEHILTNEGNYTDTFELVYSSTIEGWPIRVLPSTIVKLGGTVRPNANTTETIRIYVDIPYMTDDPPAFGGEWERTVVTATSLTLPTVTVSVRDVTTATQKEGVELYPDYNRYYDEDLPDATLIQRIVAPSGMGNKDAVFTHTLYNNGQKDGGSNAPDSYTMTVSSPMAVAVAVSPEQTGELAWHEMITDVIMTVTVAPAADHPLVAPMISTLVTATSHFSPTGDHGHDTVADVVVINQWVSAVWSSGGSRSGPADGPGSGMKGPGIVYNHILTNTGNFTDSFILSGWSSWSDVYESVEFSYGGAVIDTTPDIGPGESLPITVTVRAPYTTRCYETGTAVITATSRTPNEGVADYVPTVSVVDDITVGPYYYVELSSALERRYVSTGTPFDRSYTHWLTNTSNCTNTFDLGVYDAGPNSVFNPTITPTRTSVLASMLEPDYSPTLVTVTVTVPATDTDNLVWSRVVFSADGDSGGSGSVTDTVIVNQRVESALWPDRSQVITAGVRTFVFYTHTLRNAGNFTDTFYLTRWNEDGWAVRINNSTSPPPVELPAQGTAQVNVRVTVDDWWSVPPTVTNRTWVTATSFTPENEEAVVVYTPTAAVVDTTKVRRPHVTLSPDYVQEVDHGTTWTYTHALTNTGGLTDTYMLIYASRHPAWVTPMVMSVSDLPPGHARPVTVVVAVPYGTSYEDYDVTTITARSSITPYAVLVEDMATDVTLVPRNVSAELTPSYTDYVAPNQTIVHTHTLRNIGNYAESFTLQAETDLIVGIDPPSIGPLPAGDSTLVTVTTSIPAYAPGGYTEEVKINIFHAEEGLVTYTVNTAHISHITGTRFVDPNGTDDFNNCTMAAGQDPCQTVQHGVDQAVHGDTVKVAVLPGGSTYVDALGAAQVVLVDKSITLAGGYVNGDWDNFDPIARPTVLDAEGERRVMVIGAGITPTVEGFHLQRGYAMGDGAGLYITEGATPTVRLNRIYNNTALGGTGGGIYHGGGSGTLERNSLHHNLAVNGGGLYLEHGEPRVWTNLVYHNTANGIGGGLYNYRATVSVWNNTFYSNTADFGAGLYSEEGGLVVSNTIVVNNSNEGIRTGGGASYNLVYNDVWGNGGNQYAGTASAGAGSISQDPRFAGPPDTGLRLTFNSPCIDVGAPGVSWPDRDYEGNSRPLFDRHDIGAYEYGITGTKTVTPFAHVTDEITYTIRLTNTGSVAHTIAVTDALHEYLEPTGWLVYSTGYGDYSVSTGVISWTGLLSGNNTVETIAFTARITEGVANYTLITNVAWIDQGYAPVAETTVLPVLGTRLVEPAGTDAGDCRISPCRTVQYALGQAQETDQVKVAAGTYAGVISVSKRVTLLGGYNPPDWSTFNPNDNETTLQAPTSADPSVIINLEPVTLSGFHIVGGAEGISVVNGGSLTLSRSWVHGNDDGVQVDGGTYQLVNSIIAQNTGAGLRVVSGDGIVVYSTFDDNGDGAVVSGTARFTNTIFSNHSVGVNATGSADLWHTLWWNNTTANWQGNVVRSVDVITDPLFVDSAGMDYHILEESGAVDQGTGVPWVTEDIDGEARWVRDWPDIGADEFPLGLDKFGPSTAVPGQLITYTVVLKAVDVGLVVTDVLPAQVEFIESTNTLTCTAPSCVYLPSERTVRWAGDSTGIVTITYSVYLAPWLGKGAVVTNSAELLRAGRTGESPAWSTVIDQVPGTRYVALSGVDVDPDTGTDNNCLVVSKPCRTVQWAIEQAMAGDTVKVAAGTYTDTDGDGTAIYVDEPITLTGGYTTTGWVRDLDAFPTYLDGQNADRGVYIYRPGGLVTVDGFHIVRGYANIPGGGGLRADGNVGTAVVIANCQVYSNTVTINARGGGLNIQDADSVTLVGNRIYANTAHAFGGGVYLFGDERIALEANYVLDNAVTWSSGSGGGIHIGGLGDTVLTMTNNVVAANQAGSGGDGVNLIGLAGNSGSFVHNTVADNAGEGMRVSNFAVAMTDTIVSGHPTYGVNNQGGSVAASYTLWYGNGANWSGTVADSNPLTPGDPRFADPGTYDYHIRPGSAAFDLGVDAGVDADIDGEDRPMGLGFDVGADELRVSLDVIKWAEPDPVQAEDPLTYTIRITNTGLLTLTATITDILPLDVTPNEPVAWTLVMIPEEVQTLVVNVDTVFAGWLTNVVIVTTEEGATGVFTVTTEVTSTPDIVVTPLALSDMLPPGGAAQHTLTIDNVGRAGLSWSLVEIPTVGWLGETPTSGTVLPSASEDVAVDFGAAGLTDGQVYTATLRISSNDPETPQVDVSAVLTVCTPVSGLSFTYAPTPEVGLPVAFTAVAAGTEPIIYTWDFGDNSGGSGNPVAHTYAVSDTYTVVVTATNCYGTGQATYQEDVLVTLGVVGNRVFLPLVMKNS